VIVGFQLYLRGIFPEFAKAKVFGKYEPETIAERISLTARFLNFVLDNDVMRKAKVLHEFFAVVLQCCAKYM
jgi:hypothetical protein